MVSVLIFIGVLAGCGGLLWLSYKIEPHWVSKDGDRLICFGQGISRLGQPQGRWREVRVTKVSGDVVEIRPWRGNFAAERSHTGARRAEDVSTGLGGFRVRRNPKVTYWKVSGASGHPPRKRAVYLLDSNTDEYMPDMIALKVPANSRAIPMLESLARNKLRPKQGETKPRDTEPCEPEPADTRTADTQTAQPAQPAATESKNLETGGAT